MQDVNKNAIFKKLKNIAKTIPYHSICDKKTNLFKIDNAISAVYVCVIEYYNINNILRQPVSHMCAIDI